VDKKSSGDISMYKNVAKNFIFSENLINQFGGGICKNCTQTLSILYITALANMFFKGTAKFDLQTEQVKLKVVTNYFQITI
jgi:hypothetical protein